MKTRVCAVAVVLLNSVGPANLLLGCGDKFVGTGRGTRLQQAPRGRQESILIYNNPASDVPMALARVSVEATLRGAGYQPKTVATAAEFERELSQGKWDLVLVGLNDAQTVRQRVENRFGILPVALKATPAELKQTQKQYPVVLTKPLTNDGFIRVVYDALSSWSKTTKANRA